MNPYTRPTRGDDGLFPLPLLPEPASIEVAPNSQHSGPITAIVVAAGADRAEWVTALEVQAALSLRGTAAAIVPQIHCHHTGAAVVLAVVPRDEAVFPDIPHPALSLDHSASSEAYRLTVDPDHVVIAGATGAGVAQGARTLIQLLRLGTPLPCLTIADAPALRWRGIMLDVSRGKVPTLPTLQTIVDVMASFKLNMLQLYMENTFAFRSHPRIGEGWGPLTPEEIVALDAYCRDRYVELVPCFQSLGHHRRMLALPEYSHLSYSAEDWSLAPGSHTWRLLEELYDDLLPCFSSRYVNICCDEPWDLTHTTSQSFEAALAVGSAAPQQRDEAHVLGVELYLTHVRRLCDMLQERGRTVMIWDDIFQQAPRMLAEMPEDVIYLSWWYEAAHAFPQPEMMRRAGMPNMVCPGTSSWNSLFARLDKARGNIRPFVREGVQAGSLGVLTTDWGDNGHPNFLAASWYGYAYGGSEGWGPGRLSDEEFGRRFGRLFFGTAEGDAAMEVEQLLSAACSLAARPNGSCTLAMFFRDPLADPYTQLLCDEDINRIEVMSAQALTALEPLHGDNAERAQTLAEMRLAARQIGHAARRTRAGRRLAGLREENLEGRAQLRAELFELKKELHNLRREYQQLWLARNKPEGLWLTLDQFDAAAHVLNIWRERVAKPYTYNG